MWRCLIWVFAQHCFALPIRPFSCCHPSPIQATTLLYQCSVYSRSVNPDRVAVRRESSSQKDNDHRLLLSFSPCCVSGRSINQQFRIAVSQWRAGNRAEEERARTTSVDHWHSVVLRFLIVCGLSDFFVTLLFRFDLLLLLFFFVFLVSLFVSVCTASSRVDSQVRGWSSAVVVKSFPGQTESRGLLVFFSLSPKQRARTNREREREPILILCQELSLLPLRFWQSFPGNSVALSFELSFPPFSFFSSILFLLFLLLLLLLLLLLIIIIIIIHQDLAVTTDDMIALLAYVVIRSRPPSLLAVVEYLKYFHFSSNNQTVTSELVFNSANLQAAVQVRSASHPASPSLLLKRRKGKKKIPWRSSSIHAMERKQTKFCCFVSLLPFQYHRSDSHILSPSVQRHRAAPPLCSFISLICLSVCFLFLFLIIIATISIFVPIRAFSPSLCNIIVPLLLLNLLLLILPFRPLLFLLFLLLVLHPSSLLSLLSLSHLCLLPHFHRLPRLVLMFHLPSPLSPFPSSSFPSSSSSPLFSGHFKTHSSVLRKRSIPLDFSSSSFSSSFSLSPVDAAPASHGGFCGPASLPASSSSPAVLESDLLVRDCRPRSSSFPPQVCFFAFFHLFFSLFSFFTFSVFVPLSSFFFRGLSSSLSFLLVHDCRPRSSSFPSVCLIVCHERKRRSGSHQHIFLLFLLPRLLFRPICLLLFPPLLLPLPSWRRTSLFATAGQGLPPFLHRSVFLSPSSHFPVDFLSLLIVFLFCCLRLLLFFLFSFVFSLLLLHAYIASSSFSALPPSFLLFSSCPCSFLSPLRCFVVVGLLSFSLFYILSSILLLFFSLVFQFSSSCMLASSSFWIFTGWRRFV